MQAQDVDVEDKAAIFFDLSKFLKENGILTDVIIRMGTCVLYMNGMVYFVRECGIYYGSQSIFTLIVPLADPQYREKFLEYCRST